MTIVEPEALNDVKKFHELFNAYIGNTPHIPPTDVCELRVNLLQEELDELKQAIEDKNIVEIADALVDLQYVLSGAVLSFGLQDMFAELFAEVQYSNMSKACSTQEEADETASYYKEHKQVDSIITEKDGKYIVNRVGDKKTLKSINYHPANLGEKLKEYANS